MSTTVQHLLLVGAPRCATTSLARALAELPGASLAASKEPRFLIGQRWQVAGPRDDEWIAGIVRSREGYDREFRAGARLRIDASTDYLMDPEAPSRAAEELDRPAAIAVIRDASERAFSAYQHQVRAGVEDLAFAEALDAEETRRGMGWAPPWWYAGVGDAYADSVARWQDALGAPRVFLVDFRALTSDFEGVFARLVAALGLPAVQLDERLALPRNMGGAPRGRAGRFLRQVATATPGGLKDRLPAGLRAQAASRFDRLTLRALAGPETPGQGLGPTVGDVAARLHPDTVWVGGGVEAT